LVVVVSKVHKAILDLAIFFDVTNKFQNHQQPEVVIVSEEILVDFF